MQFKIITIAFDKDKKCFFEDELNKFCINKQILEMETKFFQINNEVYWTIFIKYESIFNQEKTLPKIQNKEVILNEQENLLYARLKEWRKEKAEKLGFPAYLIFTNTQLIEMIKIKPKSNENLKVIKNFGKKKIESYGKDILEIIKVFLR